MKDMFNELFHFIGKCINLKGWYRCFCFFLAANYSIMSCVWACDGKTTEISEHDRQYFKTGAIRPGNNFHPDDSQTSMPKVVQSNIPPHFLKTTEFGIYLEDNLQSLKKDLVLEAYGDIYINRINSLGNLSIYTTGKVFLLGDALIDGTTTIKAQEIVIQKKLKSKGQVQLLAQKSLDISGYVKSKKILQLIGLEKVKVAGVAKSGEGMVVLSGGKIQQRGNLISGQEIAANAKQYRQTGTLFSQQGTQITTTEALKLKAGSSIGAKHLSLLSKTHQLQALGDIFTEGEASLSSPDFVNLSGSLKSGDLVSVKGKDFTLTGSLVGAKGVLLNVANEWKQQGVFKAFGNGLRGKVGKLTNEGDIETHGISLRVETGDNQGSIRTRGHYSLTGKKFVNHQGSSTFTVGVHQFDFTEDYIDSGNLYTPTLLLAKARHLKFLNGHQSVFKDALLSSQVQITVAEGAKFDLFGPRVFLQFASDGSATFRGVALHASTTPFPLLKYFNPFTAEELAQKKVKVVHTSQPTEAEFRREVEQLSMNHPWRGLKKGSGMTLTVQGDVKYAGTTRLEGGAILVGAGGSVQSERGAMQAGYFTGDKVSIHATNVALDQTTIQTYFDKVSLSASDALYLRNTQLSAGMDALMTGLVVEIQRSTIASGTETSFHADDRLAFEDSKVKSQQNTLAAREIKVTNLSLQGNTSLTARDQLSIDGLTSTDAVKTASGGTTSLQGSVQVKELTSQAKKVVIDGDVVAAGAVQVIADAVEQDRSVEGETVFVQTDDYKDKKSSKTVAKKTLIHINEKGKGFAGQMQGDTVVIKLEDFQLAALKQVVANVTQLYISKDVEINQELVLNNTLQLWANKLIHRSKLKVHGDFIAQVNQEIQLNGQVDIDGIAGFIAGEGIASDRGRITAEKIYLQARRGDISLFHAVLKAAMDVKIAAEAANIKKTATMIEAGTDVLLSAAKNIEASSVAVRSGDKDNFEDQKEADRIKAGRNIEMQAGAHILMVGVEHDAGGDQTLEAGGSIVDAPLPLESQQSSGDKKNRRFDHAVVQDVSHQRAGGTFLSHAGGNQELHAPQIEARRVQISADKSVTTHEVHDTYEHQSKETHKGGFFGQDRKKKKFSVSAISKGMQLKATDSVDIKAGQDVRLTHVTSDAPKTSLTAVAGAVRLLLGKSRSSSSVMEKSSNILWQSQQSHIEEHKTLNPSSFGGALVINSKETLVESIQDQIPSFAKQLEDQGIKAIYCYLDEFNKDETKKSQGPSAALAVVVVLAVSICTAGTGAALGAAAAGALSASGAIATAITGMAAAGFTSLCSQAALALLSNEGDPIRAAESLASTRTIETLGISMVTAGVTAGVSDVLHVPQSTSSATTALDHIERQAIQMSVNTTASMVMGQRPEDALVRGLKAAAVGIVGGVASSEIGKAYTHHDINFIGHKFLHALVGGATGAVLGDKPLEGAAAGAFGAVTAEMIGELVLMNSHKIAGDVVKNLDAKDTPLTPEIIQAAVRDELRHKTDFVKLLTSGLALLAGQDVTIATFTAATAVDNNLSLMACNLTELEVYDILRQEGASIYSPAELPTVLSPSADTQVDEELLKKMEKIDPPGHKTTAKEGTVTVLDFFIGGDKETSDAILPTDDPFTNAIGGYFASRAMRAVGAARQATTTGMQRFGDEMAKEVSPTPSQVEMKFAQKIETPPHPGKSIVEDMQEVFQTTQPGKERAEKFAEQVLQKHLGDGYIIEKPKKGSDLVFYSQKRDKQIRFDVTDPHGDKPHINVEIFEPTNRFPGDRAQRYIIDGGNIHVYPAK